MFTREKLREIIDEIRAHKEHLVVDHGERDMAPILVLAWNDNTRYQVDLTDALNHLVDAARSRGVDPPPIGQVVGGVLHVVTDSKTLPPAIGGAAPIPASDAKLQAIWLAVESFSMSVHPDDWPGDYSHGDMQHDFETNPDSKVTEQLSIYICEAGPIGPEWARCIYKHRLVEGGRMVWEEPIIQTSDDEGKRDPREFDGILQTILPHLTRESLS